MAIGLGKEYWVHVIKVCFGDLDKCIKFMQDNKPDNELSWFELRPIVKVKKGNTKLEEYQCSLVEESK